jgi:hypothetical protein
MRLDPEYVLDDDDVFALVSDVTPLTLRGSGAFNKREPCTQSALPLSFADARNNFTSNTTLQVSATIPNLGAYRSRVHSALKPSSNSAKNPEPTADPPPVYSSPHLVILLPQHRKYGSSKVGAHAGVSAHWYVLQSGAGIALWGSQLHRSREQLLTCVRLG